MAIRGRNGGRATVLADHAAGDPAASAEGYNPEYRQDLYRPIQGHHARLHCRHIRSPAHDRSRADRSQMGHASHQHDRLRRGRDLLSDLLLRNVALCARDGGSACKRRAEVMNGATAHGSLLKPAKINTAVAVEIIGMNKWYGDFHVLRDINLKVSGGERIVICGPSGSGKSTMIRCINRLEEHQTGHVLVDGVELTADLKKIDEVRREV